MLEAAGVLRSITAIVVTVILQMGMAGAVDESPKDAAVEFMDGITSQQTDVMNMYMNNKYVNFMANVKGSEKATDRLRENLLKNFSYKIEAVEERDDLAVAKINVEGNDFSNVMKTYADASYEYVTDNLYSEEVTDKKELTKKSLSIYVDQIEKEAQEGELHENTIYLPMKKDEYGVWRIMLSDEIMKIILGDIALPDGVIDEGEKKD